jgi:hypothetical protein
VTDKNSRIQPISHPIVMDSLRKPFFLAAMILALLAVVVELGSTAFLPKATISAAEFEAVLAGSAMEESLDLIPDRERELARLQDQTPPGLGIRSMALLDGLILFTMGLMAMPLLLTHGLHGRIQGLLTLLVSALVVLGGILLAIWVVGQLLLMVGLFASVPFGTIAYMAMWGFFDRPGAAGLLSILMLLKLGFGICLILAHQRFLQNKGLMLLLGTSILANLVVSYLHGVAPLFLVSITDAIGGLIVIILALIWAIVLLIGSIISVVKAIA